MCSPPRRSHSSRTPWLTCQGAPHEDALSCEPAPWTRHEARLSGHPRIRGSVLRPRSGQTHVGAIVAVLAALTVTLTACAGVPERSAPEKVRAIGGSTATPVPAPAPQPGADPRAIVLGFLAANVSSLPDHNAANGFLTPEARNTWLDSPVTVVDAYQVKLTDPSTHDRHGHRKPGRNHRSERHLSDRATGRLRHPAQASA